MSSNYSPDRINCEPVPVVRLLSFIFQRNDDSENMKRNKNWIGQLIQEGSGPDGTGVGRLILFDPVTNLHIILIRSAVLEFSKACLL